MKWLLVIPLLLALWFTRPGLAVDKCLTVNTANVCNILNKE